jgi:hypothetical protein
MCEWAYVSYGQVTIKMHFQAAVNSLFSWILFGCEMCFASVPVSMTRDLNQVEVLSL